MRMEDLILISVDDHIIEPPDLFTKHISAKHKDQAPCVYRFENGEERWMLEGKLLSTFAGAALSGRKREELGWEATRYDQIRRGHYDVHARVDDMNANGTLASMCFATMPGFSGENFAKGKDKDLMLALVQAYNDWHLEEWCGAYPGRFVPMSFTPFWSAELTVAEIKRMARRGVKVICLPEQPTNFGLPSFHRDYWDPIFKTMLEEDVTAAIHIGTGGGMRFPSPDTPLDWANTMVNITVADTLIDILFSPALRKFPDLRFAMSEGCIGWVPFLMERADAAYELHHFWTKQDFGNKKPSDYLRNNFLYCFHHDRVGLKYREDVGIHRVSWECDYPHADSTWPSSPEILWEDFQHMSEREVELISHKNAIDFLHWDPFKHIARKDATVAALRAKAKHVDVSLTSIGDTKHRPILDSQNQVLTFAGYGQLQQEVDKHLGKIREVVTSV